MSKTKKFLLQGLLFCVIFVLTFFPIQGVFARKSLEKPWDMTNKISGFYHEPENEFSVMYFGSSHAAHVGERDLFKRSAQDPEPRTRHPGMQHAVC